MKFLKQKNISKFSVSDDTFIVYPNSTRAKINSNNSLRLPVGLYAERPADPENGMIRYNTDLTSAFTENVNVENYFPSAVIGFEVYYDGVWIPLRTQGPATITKYFAGNGNWDAILQPNEDISKWFPISGDPLPIVPASADAVMVIVENVFQVSTTNFTLEQTDGEVVGVQVNAGGTGLATNASIAVTFSAPDVTGTTATGVAHTDGTGEVTSITITNGGSGYTGASTPTVSVTGETGGSYTVKIAKPGYHIKFLSAVPDTKPVNIYYGYDQ
jgi:hypothetical protein